MCCIVFSTTKNLRFCSKCALHVEYHYAIYIEDKVNPCERVCDLGHCVGRAFAAEICRAQEKNMNQSTFCCLSLTCEIFNIVKNDILSTWAGANLRCCVVMPWKIMLCCGAESPWGGWKWRVAKTHEEVACSETAQKGGRGFENEPRG